MGFEAEYYSEAEELRRYKEEFLDNSTMGKNGYWRKRDGNLIKISEMTSSHIENCLDLLDTSIVRYINKCMSQNVDYEIPDDWRNKWNELKCELNKRK